MATILLSAAGAAIGSGFGGTVLGLSGAMIGRAVGATLGRSIDQRVLGGGSDAVDIGRVERFRLMGASEGAAVPRLWGRVRVSGQVIWATRFQENVAQSGGGKGAPRASTSAYFYTVSLAIALCEGGITRVGRVWADGNEIQPDSLNLRVYRGGADQLPDPKIEAVEGAGNATAYRGIAYCVIEDLDLSPFGNRVPQFSFEVIRPAQGMAASGHPDLSKIIPGVCLIPGTGEYGLATTPVHYAMGPGINRSANVNSASGKTDFVTSLEQLSDELPGTKGVSLVVSWFGNDLRCGHCDIRPMVEQAVNEGVGMPWRVSGLTRAAAAVMPQLDGRSIYGGAPTDQSVIEAIRAVKLADNEVTFYPFVLMTQLATNTLTDPWTGMIGQPMLPWRGRITLDAAPGQPGSNDQTAAAAAEVADFFGDALAAHFTRSSEVVSYSGPVQWRYRRFILHYAHLCAAAGGVDAFCIGSEMRALTQIRGASDSFPAVAALRQLAADVRAILGPATKISYAADWSEYFGHHTDGNVYFHLDPLWADPNIDFIGIDNYMPVADWREGTDHADAAFETIHNAAYLQANIAGGEGYDWYYDSPEGEAAQRRLPITDVDHDEAWIYRYKDLKNWWEHYHYDRTAGLRAASPSAWVPGSKPFRFTEFGCAAVDKGANQPNRFLDPKSSESALPKYSDGRRDDLMQLAYFQAMAAHWMNSANNPTSAIYDGPMLEFAHSHAWAWDARPYPDFPRHLDLWSDGGNYETGHWLNGRSSGQHLAAVIAEICEGSGLADADVRQAHGLMRGYSISDVTTARAILQPLLLAYPTEVVEREGKVQFRQRNGTRAQLVDPAFLAISADIDGALETSRAADMETPMKLRVSYLEAEGDFAIATADASFPDNSSDVISQSEIPLVLTASEASVMAERWMAEARVGRDTARFALPRSQLGLGAGDTVGLNGQVYRIDRIEQSDSQLIEAVRIDPLVYEPASVATQPRSWVPYLAPLPVYPLFLDLPLLTGTEAAHVPYACATATPWPGPVAVWSALSDDGYAMNTLLNKAAVIGLTETDLLASSAGRWDRGAALRVRIESGALSSAPQSAILSGANVAAIGDGSAANWEVFQFATATLVGPKTYEINLRLRGQVGTDGIQPALWPIGSTFVLISAALQQIEMPLSARGLGRHYRFGPADRGYNSAATVLRVEAFDGIGLRPYAVVHLTAERQANSDLHIGWIRRSRVDGDSWQSWEVPLAETTEAYVLRVQSGANLLREVAVSAPAWTYTAAQQMSDAAVGTVTVAVAQVSQRFGPGPFRSIDVAL
jgi:hypothetical protein